MRTLGANAGAADVAQFHQPSEPGVVLSELFPKANDQKERHK
jgi:hypothetical protein